MTPQILREITDDLGAAYGALVGSPENGHGLGRSHLPLPENAEAGEAADYGLSLACRRVTQAIIQTHDLPLIRACLIDCPQHFQLGGNLSGLASAIFSSLVTSFGHQCLVSGTPVRGIEAYSSYYNTGAGGPWKCLLSAQYAALHLLLWPGSVLPECCIQTEDCDDLLSPRGAILPLAEPYGAGYGVIRAKITGNLTAEDTALFLPKGPILSIEGRGRVRGGSIQDGLRWAGEVTGTGLFDLVPAEAGSRLLRLTRVSLPSWKTVVTTKLSGLSERVCPLVPR